MSAHVVKPEPPPQDVASYIADMLAQLADMAAAEGERRLETVIRIAAIQAEQALERNAL